MRGDFSRNLRGERSPRMEKTPAVGWSRALPTPPASLLTQSGTDPDGYPVTAESFLLLYFFFFSSSFKRAEFLAYLISMF